MKDMFSLMKTLIKPHKFRDMRYGEW